ncbi:hypothetical protein [Bradyrhizobium sp. F1.13.3]|uniref:hypothetical protein n=1 Tax=Bradyrhizobium sp. F1.13.3 TaxID=3156351 RepID=UPI0033929BC0
MKFLLNLFRSPRKQQAAINRRAGQPARPVPRSTRSGVSTVARRPAAAAPVDPLEEARRDAAHAANDVTEISRAHLATLIALPPRARIAHLTDPELTPLHQAELEASVQTALPRTAPARPAPPRLSSSRRRFLQAWGYRCVLTIVVLATAGLLAGIARRNTGERLLASNETWIIDWRLPDGSTWHGAWRTGLPAVAMHPRNGRVVLRYWLAGRGYATTEVDQGWLIANSFDYVVAPTGATGVVSPAKRASS